MDIKSINYNYDWRFDTLIKVQTNCNRRIFTSLIWKAIFTRLCLIFNIFLKKISAWLYHSIAFLKLKRPKEGYFFWKIGNDKPDHVGRETSVSYVNIPEGKKFLKYRSKSAFTCFLRVTVWMNCIKFKIHVHQSHTPL